jgi:hypothetical protein
MEREHPSRIGEAEWDELCALLAPISENYLRRLLRESGLPLAPLVEGVRQESLEALESSLLRLLEEYERDRGPGGVRRRSQVRKLMIEAKDHARWAARRDPEKRTAKEETVLWLMTWLENPPLFPEWVRLRRAALAQIAGKGRGGALNSTE